MKAFLFILSLFVSIPCLANVVDWSYDFSGDSEFYNEWVGANAYTYVLTGDSSLSVNDIASFANSWTTSYIATGNVFGGQASSDDIGTPWTLTSQDSGGSGGTIGTPSMSIPSALDEKSYLVVILEKDGNAIWAWSDTFISRDDMEAVNSDKLPCFTEDGYAGLWDMTQIGTGSSGWQPVPEAGLISTLAFGLMGVMLRRRIR